MKKHSLILALTAVLLCFVSCQKEDAAPHNDPVTPEPTMPKVEVSFPEVTSTTITAHFSMNPLCFSYTFMIAEAGSMVEMMRMFGATLEQCVQAWGITLTTDSSYTWVEQTPATDFYVYTLSAGKTADQRDTVILDSVAVRTASIGGNGESVISIQVDNITASSAKVTCSPNDQTAFFKDMLITKEAFEHYGQDSVIVMLKEDPYIYYTTDSWTWADLESNTEYYVLAIGQNAIGQWGSLARQSFTTAR